MGLEYGWRKKGRGNMHGVEKEIWTREKYWSLFPPIISLSREYEKVVKLCSNLSFTATSGIEIPYIPQ